MKKIIFFAFLIYFANSCKKLEKDFPELKSNISKVEDKFNSIEKEENMLKKETQIDSLFSFVANQDNTAKNRLYLSKILLNYYSIDKLDKLDKVSIILLKKSISSNDTVNIGLSYRSRGYFFKNNKIYDSAFYYYLKAEKIYSKLSKTDYANVLLNKGMVQYKVGDNLGADLTLTRAYLIFKEANQNQKLFETLTTLGNVSEELRDYEKAIYYHYKALELTPAFEDDVEHKKSICLNNLGFVYLNMNKYDKSIKSFEDALKDKKLKKEMPDLYSNLIDNLAYVKLKNGNLNNILPYFNESLRIRDSLGYLPNIIMSKIHISKYYFLVNDTLKSINFAKDALRLSSKNEAPANLLLSLRNITEIDLKNSSYYSKEYLRINDSLQLEERKSKDRFARIQLETDEIIQKNSELEVKNRNLVFFLFGIGGIFSLLYVVRTQKMRNRELAFKQEQQESNRQIYNLMISQQENLEQASIAQKKQMAQELHDGILSKMFGTRMNLDSLNEAHDEASINIRYNYIKDLKTIEQEIREISHGLSSEKEKLINNFVNIVINLLEEQQKTFASNLVYSIDKEISWEKLDNTAKINLYRILQESLQNINKYANATTIDVSFTQINETIVLKIEDDGSGFDLAKKKKGIGLKNMISRTEESKGTYEIISEIGKGTFTTVSLPLTTPTQTA